MEHWKGTIFFGSGSTLAAAAAVQLQDWERHMVI